MIFPNQNTQKHIHVSHPHLNTVHFARRLDHRASAQRPGAARLATRLFAQRGRGGLVENVTYRDIRLANTAGQAIQFTMNYSPSLPPTNATGTPALRNVTVDGLVSRTSKQGWLLDGLPESTLVGLTFRNVSIVGAGTYVAKCDYVDQASSACDGVTPSCPPCV